MSEMSGYRFSFIRPGLLGFTSVPRGTTRTGGWADRWQALRVASDALLRLMGACESFGADAEAGDRPRIMDLPTYLRVKNEGLRRIIRQTFRVMGDGRMIGIADVLRFEADQGRGLHRAKVR